MAEFQTQMFALKQLLDNWVKSRKDSIKEAYFTVRGSSLFFLVVSSSKAYNESLESDLTELDLNVANDNKLNLMNLEVLAIPDSPADCVQAYLGSSGGVNG